MCVKANRVESEAAVMCLSTSFACRGTYREHVEDTFKFDAKTLTAVGIFGIAFPVFLYNNIVGEYRKVDRAAGRKQRDFM